jgi:hypothetical protein
MHKLTSREKALLVISAVLVIVGCWMFLSPRAFAAQIQSTSKGGGPEAYLQGFSKGDCRTFGALAVVFGLSLGGLAFYPLRR